MIGAFVEPLVIIMILICNAAVGVWQVRKKQSFYFNIRPIVFKLKLTSLN
jgi:hypothetical protein